MGVKSWRTWFDEMVITIASVPDDDLLRVAKMIHSAKFVLTAGNGGSSAIASHAAQAVAKPSYRAGGGRPAVCLTDSIPLLTAHANDDGWGGALVEVARPYFAIPNVVLLTISSSGKSENIARLARLAHERDVRVVALTGFSGEPLRGLADVSLHVNSTDYEVVEPVHDALIHRIQYHLRTIGETAC